MLGRDRTGGGGAYIREIAVVEEQRLDQSGLCREQHHHAVDARQAELGVVEEAGADLDGETIDAGHIGGLHIDLAAMLGDVEPENRRHRHGKRGQGAEGVFDAGNSIEIERHEGAQLRGGEDGHPAHGTRSGSASASPLTTRRCRPMSMLSPVRTTTVGPLVLTLPASRAPMPTAPAPSTISRSCRWAWRMPAPISSSETRIRSSKRLPHMAKVSRLSRPMPPPS